MMKFSDAQLHVGRFARAKISKSEFFTGRIVAVEQPSPFCFRVFLQSLNGKVTRDFLTAKIISAPSIEGLR